MPSQNNVQQEVTHVCHWCGSENTIFEQDLHHKSTNNSINGVVVCHDCKQISFWYFKSKEKVGISSGKLIYKVKPALAVVEQWDGPITQFIYDHICQASKATGRPIESYYTTYTMDTNNIIEHRLDFSEILEAIRRFEGRVLTS